MIGAGMAPKVLNFVLAFPEIILQDSLRARREGGNR
jgi:hypothetical protein